MASFVEPDGKRQRKEEKVLVDRTVRHASLPQSEHQSAAASGAYTFVIGADPQLGMRNSNRDWDAEMESSEKTVTFINNMATKPAFVCVCGDLVDMEEMAYTGEYGTKEECLAVQAQQYSDFTRIFSRLHADIPLLCLCGNHGMWRKIAYCMKYEVPHDSLTLCRLALPSPLTDPPLLVLVLVLHRHRCREPSHARVHHEIH